MSERLSVKSFLEQSRHLPVLDVRTPAEYESGHIPGSINVALFTNEERARVGTLYKQEGRERAILEGLEFVGPKMKDMVEAALRIHKTHSESAGAGKKDEPPTLLVHCWRGGMRSESVSWLLELYGFQIRTLEGGYKKFRNLVLDSFEEKRQYVILGGNTGSGKTKILKQLASMGEQVVDLEGIANHQGSAFGHLGKDPQPTEEQFQNELGFRLESMDHGKRIWLEDESRTIGRIALPASFWSSMEDAPLFYLKVPLETRIRSLIADYGEFPIESLNEQVTKLQKRLGDERTRETMAALESGDLELACRHLLYYYDRAYQYGIDRRPPSRVLTLTSGDETQEELAGMLKDAADAAGL